MAQIITTPLTSPMTTISGIDDNRTGLDAAAFKAKFDEDTTTLADKINELIAELDTNVALLSDLADIVAGSISNGSIDDDKLSDTAGQIKNRVALHIADLNNPHQTDAADISADPAGTAATAVSNHNSAATPHTGRFETSGAVSAHDSAATPHTGKFEAASAVSNHNSSGTAHTDIRNLIVGSNLTLTNITTAGPISLPATPTNGDATWYRNSYGSSVNIDGGNYQIESLDLHEPYPVSTNTNQIFFFNGTKWILFN